MTEQREQSASDAVDRLIESRRRGEDNPPSEQPYDADDLAVLATTLEDQWAAQPQVDEDAIWQRVNVGMRSTVQSQPGRWPRLPTALASLSLPASWFGGRTPALVTAALAIVLVVVATFATQRESAHATFVTDVDNLARFTAAVLNDRQLSPRERGEVERRASGLLSVVQANPSVLAELDSSDAELVVARIDGILTLLEPYEHDRHGGVETSIVPLASVRAQVENARAPEVSPREAFSPTTETPPIQPQASTTTATPAESPASTPGAQGRGDTQPRRTPDATGTPGAPTTPAARLDPGTVPPVDRGALRDLCGDERGSGQGRCRAAMAQLESACERGSDSERCKEAFEDALERCRDLRDDEAAAECQRILLVLTAALASDDGEDGNRGRGRDTPDDDRGQDSRGGDDEREGADERDDGGGRSRDREQDDDGDEDDRGDDRGNPGRRFERGPGGGDRR